MRLTFIALLFCLGSLNFFIQGQNIQKIGYVYTDTVLFSLEKTGLKRKELEVYGKQLQISLEKKQQFIQQKYAVYIEYTKSPANIVPKVKEEKEKELQKLQEELQEQQKEAQINLGNKEQKLIAPLQNEIKEAVKKYAKTQAYAYIFSGNIFHTANKGDNCTDKIIAQLGGNRENIEKIVQENKDFLQEAQQKQNKGQR